MKARIGYFIPEFPGQTHIFFWRERQILSEIGIETSLVSTRRPPQAIASHTWAKEAEKDTNYLAPLTLQDVATIVIELLKAGPIAWLNCLSLIAKSKDTSLVQKLRLLVLVLIAAKLVRLSRDAGWNHIHVHSCADAANVAMFASILAGLSYSLSLHGPTLEDYGLNQEQKWHHAAFALVISEKLFTAVKDKLASFLPRRVLVAPMGVNLDKIKRYQPYTPWESGLCKIYSCGRLNPIKGHKDLIEMVSLLRQRGFDVRLQIAGNDEQGGTGYRQELERIIQDKQMSNYVELLGAVSETQVRQGLEEAHFFALASLNEGIPVAVMEAMAMEMPVIVTDVGGTSELVDSGVDAILVQPENPEEMADAIVKILENQELALCLSQESRKKIVAKFHHRVSAEVLAGCLEELARGAKNSQEL
jgi:colanic acid/amylovoran biosynthesis glycosyltransferase